MIITELGNEVKSLKTIPSGIVSEEEQKLIRAFLQGAVYAWCNCKKQEEFQFATFLGNENYYWQGTPLYSLYYNQLNSDLSNSDEAFLEAAKYGGIALKQVLISDKRIFKARKIISHKRGISVNVYSWSGE